MHSARPAALPARRITRDPDPKAASQTPLGDAPIDSALAQKLAQAFPKLRESTPSRTRREHSLEVQLPFLQRLVKTSASCPWCWGRIATACWRKLGHAVAQVIAAEQEVGGGNVLIVASSDMNHYESDVVTRTKDKLAIEKISGSRRARLIRHRAQPKASPCVDTPPQSPCSWR